MELRTETELTQEIERLRAELARRERQAADNERQLERYATDLRETFKDEGERTQQLTRSYMATVRALSNAVEARDAYIGKHAERVAVYGIEFLSEAAKVVRSHHERWDGSGYPDGLRAEKIPLAARVFAGRRRARRPHHRPSLPAADAVRAGPRNDR
jgi:HD-GYP domain-containing protein (c-di-GMP phosphodiesterase class II)